MNSNQTLIVEEKRKTTTDSLSIKDRKVEELLNYSYIDSINCDDSAEYFSNLKLNNTQLKKISKKKWLAENSNYDSIVENYIYYGKSSILIDESGVVTFTIKDSKLNLVPLGTVNIDCKILAKKFPCSYKKISKDIYEEVECYSFEVFDNMFNKIRYYIKDNQVIAITYFSQDELPFE